MAHHGHESSAALEREVRAQRAEISEMLTEIRERRASSCAPIPN
jgi:hypothetical protein